VEFSDLERSVDRALRQLPGPHAPHTLLPRVLAAAARLADRPWYARTWFTWPLPVQAAALVAAVALIGVTFALSAPMDAAGLQFSRYLTAAVSSMPGLLDVATAMATMVQVAWRSVLQPLAIFGFVVIVLMLLTGGACWTVVNRLTLTSEKA